MPLQLNIDNMGKIFLSLALFVFINANSQIKDSLLEIMEKRSLSEEAFAGKLIGNLVPDFTAKDLNGMKYTGKIARNGKITFVNFWYLGCAPCIVEIPNLNRLYLMTKDNSDVQFFSITWEPESHVKEAIKKYDIRFPVLMTSPGDIHQLTFARGYPVNMVLDRKGRVYSFLSGGSLTPGSEFELYWNREIGKIVRGDTATVPQPIQISENIPGITFIDSSKIQSFDLLANYFKGQSLYIDLWASWSFTSRQEFSSKNNAVDSFLDRHKIVRLYLSIDNPQAGETWKGLIYQYQLTGYHLLAGRELMKDLKQTIYKKGIYIPRHIIVKNGKIVELNAFPPSDGQKLILQLTEKLF
jgi:peroxiredoxin